MSNEKFVYQGDDLILSQCAYCARLGEGPAAVCAAFPGSIPAEILSNDYDHRKPWIDPKTGQPGDQGVALAGSITFEPKPTVRREALKRLTDSLDQLSSP